MPWKICAIVRHDILTFESQQRVGLIIILGVIFYKICNFSL